MNSLIGARVLQGIGAAGRQSVAVIIILDLATPDSRYLWLGLLNMSSAIGLAIGPVLGAIFSVDTNWRWIFRTTLILINVTMVISITSLRYPIPHRKQTIGLLAQLREVDFIGCLLAVAIASSICIAIEMGNKMFPWDVSVPEFNPAKTFMKDTQVYTNYRPFPPWLPPYPRLRLLRTKSGQRPGRRHAPISYSKHSHFLSHQLPYRRSLLRLRLLPTTIFYRHQGLQLSHFRDPNVWSHLDTWPICCHRCQHPLPYGKATTHGNHRRCVVCAGERTHVTPGA